VDLAAPEMPGRVLREVVVSVITSGRRVRAVCLSTCAVLGVATVTPVHAGTAAAAGSPPNAVVEWNEHAGDVAVASCISPVDNPLHESRMYALVQLAVHDSLQAIRPRSEPYAFHARAPHASPRAAVAGAAYTSLVGALGELEGGLPAECLTAARSVADDAYAASVDRLPATRRTERGLALGRRAATAVLALRADDGSDTPLVDDTYPQGDEPGEWRFTPDRPFAFAPGWGEVEPFGLGTADQFQRGHPYSVDSRRYTRDFRIVKRLGSDGVSHPTRRTEEMTEVAAFWVESSPLWWNRLTRTLATRKSLGLWRSARLFGLVNVAMADGYIASFDRKYDDPFWRPVTAIREAGHDGNPRTRPDPDWTPLFVTPPIPDHDSAHAVEGGAAATVLRRYFGTDAMSFSMCSHTAEEGRRCTDSSPLHRSFESLRAAARENAVSRVLVGFHFPHAAWAGLRHGQRIGSWTVRTQLAPR
jgi:hypothetical protein